MNFIKELEEKTLDFQKEMVVNLLSKCTEGQRETFNRIFPGGIGKIKSMDKMKDAYRLCRVTVINNEVREVKE